MLPDGQVVAEVPNPAVPTTLLEEILNWKMQGATTKDVLERLRVRTVPMGYSPHTWTPGIILNTAYTEYKLAGLLFSN